MQFDVKIALILLIPKDPYQLFLLAQFGLYQTLQINPLPTAPTIVQWNSTKFYPMQIIIRGLQDFSNNFVFDVFHTMNCIPNASNSNIMLVQVVIFFPQLNFSHCIYHTSRHWWIELPHVFCNQVLQKGSWFISWFDLAKRILYYQVCIHHDGWGQACTP